MSSPEYPSGSWSGSPGSLGSAPSLDPVSDAAAVSDPSGPPSPRYPVSLEIGYPSELNRWLPLIKWLLIIPHFIALFFILIGAFFALVIGFFAVLFTGRWPRGAFDYLAGTHRWIYRVLVYIHLMTDAYPPFSLADHPDYPVRVSFPDPDQIAHWRPLVQWLLVLPYAFVAAILYWLTGVLSFLAFFTVLFTKRVPRGLFELMVPGLRWQLRASAYSYFVTDRYPPFVWG